MIEDKVKNASWRNRFAYLGGAGALFCLLALAVPLQANPSGASVVAGSAAISQSGSTLNIVNSDRAIINWRDFSIGAGETTNFLQPGINSAVLNRVIGTNLSAIYGTLSSNGKVFLINPNGILIGSSGIINTAGFLGSTLDVANSEFLANTGTLHFLGSSAATVQNLGTINATGGDVYLIARQVQNSGTINAPSGTAGLYASEQVTLTTGQADAGSVLLSSTSFPNSAPTGVSNSGLIQAAKAELKATGNMYALAINNTGVIRATGTQVQNGVIHLVATGGTLQNSGTLQAVNADGSGGSVALQTGSGGTTTLSNGTIDVSSQAPGKKGGNAEMTGDAVILKGNSLINASGPAGGGVVLIGGDAHGANPDVYDATLVQVGPGVTIKADATVTGDGGKVILWSRGLTQSVGTLLAREGPGGGAGGFIETSGETVGIGGVIDAGQGGTWLLDPNDLTIDASLAATIDASLNRGTSVTEQTTASGTGGSGDITVAAAINWVTSASFTLSAYRDIVIDQPITSTGGGAVTLQSDATGTGSGTVSFSGAGAVSTSGAVTIYYNPTNPVGTALGTVNATEYTTPTNFSSDVSGGATLTSYMLVNNIEDLQNLNNNLSGNYALGRDIDATATPNWNGGAGFTPIGGNSYSYFTGIFNGQDHTINGLTIDLASQSYVGMFGEVSSATIENVNLAGVNVAGTEYYNGGLVGYADTSTILGDSVTGTVQGTDSSGSSWTGGLVGWNTGTVSYSFSNANVTGVWVTGGLVGENYGGTVSNSYSSGGIASSMGPGSNSNNFVGGLVGGNYGTIQDSFSNDAAQAISAAGSTTSVGGLSATLESSSATILASYSTGTAEATGNGNKDVGGLVGNNLGGSSSSVVNSFWDVTTSGIGVAGSSQGGIGGGPSAGQLGETTAALQMQSTYPAGRSSGQWDFSTVWAIDNSVNNGLPTLRGLPDPAASSGTSSSIITASLNTTPDMLVQQINDQTEMAFQNIDDSLDADGDPSSKIVTGDNDSKKALIQGQTSSGSNGPAHETVVGPGGERLVGGNGHQRKRPPPPSAHQCHDRGGPQRIAAGPASLR